VPDQAIEGKVDFPHTQEVGRDYFIKLKQKFDQLVDLVLTAGPSLRLKMSCQIVHQ
jgi:hypothetical protein